MFSHIAIAIAIYKESAEYKILLQKRINTHYSQENAWHMAGILRNCILIIVNGYL